MWRESVAPTRGCETLGGCDALAQEEEPLVIPAVAERASAATLYSTLAKALEDTALSTLAKKTREQVFDGSDSVRSKECKDIIDEPDSAHITVHPRG